MGGDIERGARIARRQNPRCQPDDLSVNLGRCSCSVDDLNLFAVRSNGLNRGVIGSGDARQLVAVLLEPLSGGSAAEPRDTHVHGDG